MDLGADVSALEGEKATLEAEASALEAEVSALGADVTAAQSGASTMQLAAVAALVIGVVVGLIIFKSYFGFFGFLGAIALAGIVINNAIVLIDRIDTELIESGHNPGKAIIEACRQRFRPILLTTFTTSLGLIPLYLGGGLMWEPLAVAIMAGLLFSTIITLFFIPALYSLLYRVSVK